MSATLSPMTVEEENAFIASLEQAIEEHEYARASNDVESYMRVSRSLEGLLGNEKAVCHLKDFVVDERCEENVLFLLDVSEYKKMYYDNNYKTNQKLMKVEKIVKQYLTPGSSYSQLYIPLTIIDEFKNDYQPWEKREGEQLPPISLFDKVESVVLESIRKTSYQKFIRSKNINSLLAMTIQDIKSENPIELYPCFKQTLF